ncbi:MAG: hypothetical protein EXS32_02075 [Opitutus sp.]|nr:hypothetical protein [Opitutus sp.]
MRDSCRLQLDAFRALPGSNLPDGARRLLDHGRDMTSTLADFHASDLRVEVLQVGESEDFYLREVFLRTTATDRVVEYGVLAVALNQFNAVQRTALTAGRTPLGAILHKFEIPFDSSPLGFFAVPASLLPSIPAPSPVATECFGRFNRLAKPSGEPLAWILEILPSS